MVPSRRGRFDGWTGRSSAVAYNRGRKRLNRPGSGAGHAPADLRPDHALNAQPPGFGAGVGGKVEHREPDGLHDPLHLLQRGGEVVLRGRELEDQVKAALMLRDEGRSPHFQAALGRGGEIETKGVPSGEPGRAQVL